MVEFGPISMIAIGFPDSSKLHGDLVKEIFRLRKEGIIRVVGLLAVAKDSNGKVSIEQLTDLSKDERVKLSAAVASLIGFGAGGEEGRKKGWEAGAKSAAANEEFGLSQEKVKHMVDNIPNGTAAGLMLVEHLWAKKFKEIASQQGGILLANTFITPQSLVALGAELAEAAKVAEQVQYQ